METKLNYELAVRLQENDISGATKKAIEFLKSVYGNKSVDYWALRDFYNRRIAPADDEMKSLFDRNVEWLMRLREEKALGWVAKPKYESKWFKGDTLEQLDSLFAQYKESEGRPTLKKFMNEVEKIVAKS